MVVSLLNPSNASPELLDFRLSLLDQQIEHLTQIKCRIQESRQKAFSSSLHRLPLVSIARFLSPIDNVHLAQTSRLFRESLTHRGQLVIPHVAPSNRRASGAAIRVFLQSRLCLPAVESLHINLHKNEASGHFLQVLARQAGLLSSLRRLAVVGGALPYEHSEALGIFFRNFFPASLEDLHLSGLQSLSQVGRIVQSQKESLKSLRIDYLCANHGTTVDADVFPTMPLIEELVLDVADLSEVKAEWFVQVLRGVQDVSKLKRIYMPHIEIIGTVDELRVVLEEVKRIARLGVISELVLRFHSLSLGLNEFYDLRETLSHLPACCLSRTFVVALNKWASWWPAILDVWKQSSQVTGRALFKEQIDFGSLGSCADREWLRLPKDRKMFWSNKVLPKVEKFWNIAHQNAKAPDHSGM